MCAWALCVVGEMSALGVRTHSIPASLMQSVLQKHPLHLYSIPAAPTVSLISALSGGNKFGDEAGKHLAPALAQLVKLEKLWLSTYSFIT